MRLVTFSRPASVNSFFTNRIDPTVLLSRQPFLFMTSKGATTEYASWPRKGCGQELFRAISTCVLCMAGPSAWDQLTLPPRNIANATSWIERRIETFPCVSSFDPTLDRLSLILYRPCERDGVIPQCSGLKLRRLRTFCSSLLTAIDVAAVKFPRVCLIPARRLPDLNRRLYVSCSG